MNKAIERHLHAKNKHLFQWPNFDFHHYTKLLLFQKNIKNAIRLHLHRQLSINLLVLHKSNFLILLTIQQMDQMIDTIHFFYFLQNNSYPNQMPCQDCRFESINQSLFALFIRKGLYEDLTKINYNEQRIEDIKMQISRQIYERTIIKIKFILNNFQYITAHYQIHYNKFKMSRKQTLYSKQTKRQAKKHFSPKSLSYQQKPEQTWCCKVCRTTCLITQPYCLQCYQSLYYYIYVNAFLFVQKDEGIQKLYEEPALKEVNLNSNMTNGKSYNKWNQTSQENQEQMENDQNYYWINNLLTD